MAATSGGQDTRPPEGVDGDVPQGGSEVALPGGDAGKPEDDAGKTWAAKAARPLVTKWMTLHLERSDKSVNYKLTHRHIRLLLEETN